MSNKLRLCAALTSLGFALYASQNASASQPSAPVRVGNILDRVALLHAAQSDGAVRVEIVGPLKEALGLTTEAAAANLKTADWLQTFNQQFNDAKPG